MCRALQDLGVEVTLATTNHGLPNLDHDVLDEAVQTTFEDVHTYFFRFAWGESFKYSWAFARWLNKNVSLFDLVHIHAVFNHACVAAARACRRHQIPYIVRPLGSLEPWGMQQKWLRKWLFWRVCGELMCGRSAAIHYTGAREKEASEALLGLNHGKVVPLGIDEPLAMTQTDTTQSVQKPGPYILTLSRLLPTKGIDVLLAAFLSVVAKPAFSNWSLVIAGDGPANYVTKLREMARGNQFGHSVVFTGWLDEQAKWSTVRQAALLALPSQHENFGLCVIEALACGVPVLVSPNVGLAEDVAANGVGWVVPVDRESVMNVLSEAFAHPQLLSRKGAAAKQLSRQFEWSVVGKQLETLYQSVLDHSDQSKV